MLPLDMIRALESTWSGLAPRPCGELMPCAREVAATWFDLVATTTRALPPLLRAPTSPAAVADLGGVWLDAQQHTLAWLMFSRQCLLCAAPGLQPMLDAMPAIGAMPRAAVPMMVATVWGEGPASGPDRH